MRLMYMDECKSQHTGIVSLTAIVIDEERYSSFRQSAYAAMAPYIHPEENVFLHPPELHGNCFLPNAKSDADRAECLTRIYIGIRENGARIYRCGYYRDPEVFESDSTWLAICFGSIQRCAQSEFQNSIILPIMDGADPNIARTFSASNHGINALLSCGFNEDSISLANMPNIADPVVSDSRFSICTQAADLVSYGFHCIDWQNSGLRVSEFKQLWIDAMAVLEPCIHMSEVIRLENMSVQQDNPRRP